MTRGRWRPSGVGRALGPTLAILVVIVLAGCGGEGSIASPIATTTVDLPKSYRFAPPSIVVAVGATVTWTNHDDFTHNVDLDGVDPLPMSPGDSVSHTFAAAGAYPYVCSLHPNDMTGTILVTTDQPTSYVAPGSVALRSG